MGSSIQVKKSSTSCLMFLAHFAASNREKVRKLYGEHAEERRPKCTPTDGSGDEETVNMRAIRKVMCLL